MDDKEKYLRWLEMLWDLHEGIAREEQRKDEVLEMFEGLGRLARNHVQAPRFPPWEAPW